MIGNLGAYSRVFIEIGPLTIYWYAIIIVTGVLIGLWMATKESVRIGLPQDTFSDLLMYALPISILSARLYYVIFEWQSQVVGQPWWNIFAVWEGGIAIHGAIIGGVLTGVVFSKRKGIPFWKLADVAGPSLIVGQAIGRWGNFMNQEAHGGPVSDAAYQNFIRFLPDFIENQMVIDGVLYHPTFLYESIWNFLVLGGLIYLRKRNPIRGEVFLQYIIWYSVGRFFIEGLRTDSLYMFDLLRTAQMISIVMVIVGIGLIIYRRQNKREPRRYNGTKVK